MALIFGFLSFPLQTVIAQVPGPVNLQGTGGTVTTQGNDIIHTFTAGGTFTPPPGVTQVQVLVVGGGGGGGSSFPFGTAGSGGGGAGGLVYNATFPVAGPVAVSVGGGGAGANNPAAHQNGTNGGNSTFGSITALGGGGGAGGNNQGTAGGSGGGSRGAAGGVATQPGSGSGGFGFRGGNFPGSPGGAGASGGGGAGAAGQDLPGNVGQAGNGGVGLQYSISGAATYYAGGGGGGNVDAGAPGTGGLGGGGTGTNDNVNATPGTANRGGGGGGGNDDRAGAAGGSGIVIVRYTAPTLTITQQPSASATSAVPFAQQPVIRLLNGAGSPLVGVNITASIASGSGSLGGTVVIATGAGGLATFTNLAITGSGNHTIRFVAAGATQSVVSNVVNIPATIALTQQPSASTTTTLPFTQQPVVRLLNGGGSPIVGVNITASIQSGSGSLGGTVTVATNGSGLATFTNLAITGSGNHTLRFSAAGYTVTVDSNVINVAPPSIAITQQASSPATTTMAFAQQPVIRLLRASGAAIIGRNITASIQSGSGSLGGTVTVATDGSGLATFTNLAITGTGIHTLRFSAAGFSVTVDSSVIAVNPAPVLGCPGFDGTSSPVIYQACSEVKDLDGDTQVTVLAPASTQIGDYLVIALVVNEAPRTITAPGTLTTINVGTNIGSGDNDMMLGVYAQFATAAGAQPFTFTVPDNDGDGNDQILGWAMRFSNTLGYDTNPAALAFDSNTGNTITSPGITTSENNSLVLRIIGVDDDDFVDPVDTNLFPVGQSIITLDRSNTGNQTVSGTAAYAMQPVAGGAPGSQVLNVTGMGNEQWRAVTMALRPVVPFYIISHGGVGFTCAPNQITITRDDGLGNVDTDFTGTINLSTSTGNGTWSYGSGGATGTLTNLGGGNATYKFELGDAGVVTLDFSSPLAATVNFNILEGSYTEAPGSDPNLVVGVCSFLISHALSGGTCAPTSVTISAFSSAYTGTITISTNPANGTWSKGSGGALGILTDTTPGDGLATYTFVPGDNGVVTLEFSNTNVGVKNFNITDGTYSESTLADPNLTISACQFRISHTGSTDTCTPETVNFRISTPAGATVAGYTGTVTISTDTGSGYWAIGSANGSLTPGPGDGTAVYTFDSADLGIAQLSFYSTNAQTVNFNVIDGILIEDAGFDPDLVITDCAPSSPLIGPEVCSSDAGPATQADLSITAGANRLVLLVAGSEGNVTPPAATATFNGTGMTLIARALTPGQGGGTWGNMVDIFAILESALPGTGGPYTAAYTAGLEDNSEFCVLQVTDVEQVIPLSGAGQPANITVTTAGGNSSTTNITTAAANAVAFSAVSTGGPVDSTARTLTFEWEFDFGGGGTSFIASSGIIPAAGPIGITETFNATPGPARIAHNVASFSPPAPAASQFSISHNNTGGTCSANVITISALNSFGAVDINYTGTMTITANSGIGDWSALPGNSSIVNNGTVNDGAATYYFAPGDAGTVDLGFTQISAGTVNFDVTDGSLNESIFFDNDLLIGDCAFRISNTGNAYTCSQEAITITAVDAAGNTLTGYAGTISLSTSTNNGVWSQGAGMGTLLNVGGADDGQAAYTFDVNDFGVAVLDFHHDALGLFNIDVTDGTYSEEGVTGGIYDPNITVAGCEYRITHGLTGGTCTPSSINIAVVDGENNLGNAFNGTMTLTTTTNNGTWGAGSSNGILTDITANDGQATYQFSILDGGSVTLTFSDPVVETTNINITGAGYSVNPAYDNDLVISACAFQISFSGGNDSDVCSIKEVTITPVDSSGSALGNYSGTVNLSTSTGNGTWTLMTGGGTFSDPSAEDGAASYTFSGSESAAVFNFRDVNNEVVNIDVTDGLNDEDPAFDPDLTVLDCSFRISHSASMSACSVETVTIEVLDRNGLAANDFIGTIALTTSTNNGNWLATSGFGTLTDTNPNDGIGFYTFVSTDTNTITLDFADETVETVSIDIDFNGSSEGPGTDDPSLVVSACVPTIISSACYVNQSQVDAININSSAAALGSRMLLVYTDSDSLFTVTTATLSINAATIPDPFVFGKTQQSSDGGDNTLQVFGILDGGLPAGADNLDLAFTGDANTAMCLVYLEGVKQTKPNDTGTSAGQINSSAEGQNPGGLSSTSLTTLKNNSLVLSAVARTDTNATFTSSLGNSIWTTGATDPAGVDWEGNSDAQPTPALVVVTEDYTDNTPNGPASHIVLALPPFIDGNPAAVGYVPVTLYKTYSGNLNYRAVGASMRTADNPASCVVTASTISTVNIPPGSTVVDAWLYWAGSGSDTDAVAPISPVDNIVDFGPVNTNPNVQTITADEIFLIENPLGLGADLKFFLGYKNVTGLMTNDVSQDYQLSGLDVDLGTPYSSNQTCLAGWALVVVYDNPAEDLNVINLFHGFQPFRNSNFSLVPRNFRMGIPDGVGVPDGQMTHITFESDAIPTGGEQFGLQNNPAALTFTDMTNANNPPTAQYNSTITQPIYLYQGAPTNTITFTGVYDAISTSSWGVDVDTYYIAGATAPVDPLNPTLLEILYPFGISEAEEITTRYSSGGDLVLLAGEFISVTNAPIADLEIKVSESGTFKVGSTGTGTFNYEVVNNGNNASSNGFTDSEVILTGNLPVGMTINSITAPAVWDCASIAPTTTAFTCTFNTAAWLGGSTPNQLDDGESLPLVQVSVDIDDEDPYFPLVSNLVSQSARIAYFAAGSCVAEPAGIQPDPTLCTKAGQFDNVNDLDHNSIDIDDLDEGTSENNNVVKWDTVVGGIVTDLAITKQVVGVLEENQPGQYLLTITNNGPDITTKTMTVTDTLPAGLVPVSAAGTNWNCPIPVGQGVTCTRTMPLGVGASTTINIFTSNIVAPAVEGAFVNNIASVSAAAYNFDTVPGNNSATLVSQIVGQPVASNQKFLLTVNEASSIGASGDLGPYQDGDLFIYDPVADITTEFLLESSIPGVTNLNNINALHLLPNGHILMSTDTNGSQIANLTFNEGDIVLYDPVLQTATKIVDGSTVFTGAADIDAIHVNYNNSYDPNDWDIIFSTVDDSLIGATTYDDNDLIFYDVSAGTPSITIHVDGASGDMFNSDNGDIDALYIRYDDANIYTLSTDDTPTITIGINGTQDTYSQDDLVEIDLTTPGMPVAGNVFLGDVANGIFLPDPGTNRKIDGVHVIEDGYFGHFAIFPMNGDTCSATSITIQKHVGLSHVVDSAYQGTIKIDNNLGGGIWAKDVTASGAISNPNPGEAYYTFTAADNGSVILYLTQSTATINVNVDVTNGISVEDSNEDDNFDIDNVVTLATYRDEFSSVSFANNDGIAAWSSSWSEINDNGIAGSGNVAISGGVITISDPGGNNPGIIREVDFTNYNAGPVTLNFDWQTSNVSPVESFQIFANDGSGDTLLTTITGYTGISSGSESISLPPGLSTAGTMTFSFIAAAGYVLESFSLDNIEVATSTTDCNVGVTLDHYSITNNGPGILCLASYITIEGHSLNHSLVAPQFPNNTIALSTGGTGTWLGVVSGGGVLIDSVPGDGMATYQFPALESSVTLAFINDGQVADPAFVDVDVSDGGHFEAAGIGHDDSLIVNRAGLRFFNMSKEDESMPTLVSGKSSDQPLITAINDVISIQAIRTNDLDTKQCMPLFADGSTPQIQFAAECVDPVNCAGEQVSINGVPVGTSNITPVNADYVTATVSVSLQTGGGGVNDYIGGILDINYPDAGEMRLYARYTIPGTASTAASALSDFSQQFVVRPFGYDIDFNEDRKTNGQNTSAESFAIAATGDPDANEGRFAVAGTGFDTTVRAVIWDALDDPGGDGIPDPGADLTDNNSTPNYGNEQNAAADRVTISHSLVLPAGGNPGILGGTTAYQDFSVGEQTQTLTFSEVGIINLSASLDAAANPTGYLDGGQSITGEALNVGRFYPADFSLSAGTLIQRPLFTPSVSAFTYMGEPFKVEFVLTARNSSGTATENYVGDFALLDSLSELSFKAVQDVSGSADIDYTPRLAIAATDGVPTTFGASWGALTSGTITISGNLVFSRQLAPSLDVPEAPLTPTIAVTVMDEDSVIDIGRNVDEDDGSVELGPLLYNLLGNWEVRYGRIRLENAYGSEIPEEAEPGSTLVVTGEDLPIHIVAEYFDGTEFILNTDDIATPYSSANLSTVTSTIGVALTSLGNGTIKQGETLDETGAPNRPLYLTAPGDGFDGDAVLELDLSPLGLDFLKFDWRGPLDIEDLNEDGDYTDNPRGLVEFGAYEQNERIINWQELFLE